MFFLSKTSKYNCTYDIMIYMTKEKICHTRFIHSQLITNFKSFY